VAENRIKLKRTGTAAKVPNISDLRLGELAINTFDGKLFFLKNDGSDSLESIVTTNAEITGSVILNGSIASSAAIISNDSPSTNLFLVKIAGQDKLKVNSDGTLVITETNTLPIGENGAIAVSGSNFFIYL
jgi:archaellum component FlaG (FlaF/FlaG flagellin family)